MVYPVLIVLLAVHLWMSLPARCHPFSGGIVGTIDNIHVNAGHCGASVSELHNGLEILLSLSKVKIDVANTVWQVKQRLATAVFSQHHHDKMVLHRFVLF